MHRIRLFLTIVLGLAVVVLAVANRHDVALSLSPLPWTIELPLYALLLLTFAVGVVAGGFAVWTGRLRRQHRTKKRQEQRRERAAKKQGAAPTSKMLSRS